MENKHKAAGKESMVIKNQKQNAMRTKQQLNKRAPKVTPAAGNRKKTK